MYLQITNRCNMTCEHCCNNCTAEGEDMSLETFRKALKLCEEYGQIPFIGGGEPTLHPLFEQMLMEAMPVAVEQGSIVGVITNGSMNRRALMIATLTKFDLVDGELSQDAYHDPIDDEVRDAFIKAGTKRGSFNSGIRDTSKGGTRECLPHGRGVELMGLDYHSDEPEDEDNRDENDCPCNDWMVYPDGTIRQCGCDNSVKIGDTESGISTPHSGECFHDPSWVDACLDNEGEYEHLLYG